MTGAGAFPDGEGLHVTALIMEPVQVFDHVRPEFYALRVDIEAAVVYLAQPGDHIEISAWRSGEKDVAVFIFDLFETADAAPLADCLPCFLTVVFPNRHW